MAHSLFFSKIRNRHTLLNHVKHYFKRSYRSNPKEKLSNPTNDIFVTTNQAEEEFTTTRSDSEGDQHRESGGTEREDAPTDGGTKIGKVKEEPKQKDQVQKISVVCLPRQAFWEFLDKKYGKDCWKVQVSPSQHDKILPAHRKY